MKSGIHSEIVLGTYELTFPTIKYLLSVGYNKLIVYMYVLALCWSDDFIKIKERLCDQLLVCLRTDSRKQLSQ